MQKTKTIKHFLSIIFASLTLTACGSGGGSSSISPPVSPLPPPPPPPPRPTMYYAAPLSTSCDPSVTGSGTLADPWTNPYYALTQGDLQPGDTLQLRAGVYRNEYDGFMPDDSDADRRAACDDDQTSSVADGKHTVLPLFIAGTAAEPIIIENYPGETVVIDGTNARMESADWVQCGTNTYRTSDFNVGNARSPQIWVDPADALDPGTRLKWSPDNSADCDLLEGEFSVEDGGRNIYVHLPGGGNPANHDIRMSCQNGDCATHPIASDGDARYLSLRRHVDGGGFVVKYGYYNAFVDGGSDNLDFDGVDWVAAGGRNYGHCVRVFDGNDIAIRNGICREAMSEGIGLYGGQDAEGIQTANNIVENMDIFDTGRGWVDGGGSGNSLGMGVIVKNCRDCIVRGNTIRGSYRSGIQVNHSRNGCPTNACDSSNVLIERNELSDFCRVRQSGDPDAGQTDCGAVLLRANGTNGFIDGGTIRNNVIYGNFTTPFTNDAAPSGIYTDGDIPNVEIVNNSLNQIPGACINVGPNPNAVRIVGNAMDNCSTSGSGCNGQVCALNTDGVTVHDTNYNTYWATGDSVQVIRRNAALGFTRDTVAAGFETTAVQASPSFISDTDLRLDPGSGLIDVLPCSEAAEEDFAQVARPQGGGCDVGAFEQ